ncbi:class Ib ribonucleoside-diphosphate reductase assembly flavoprotein NrdI [Micropruina sonneratiae]|uniref:class Ib ribonucleoside-diphosphate reductase assembly flavoprotein NrdI n=1 Tax=Micropruina sonneratiae TaxID=2986940 RepID=UPI002226BD13|nr:class Ib ribonucleoside-diphosphate reductase assembly flavoprotein NrdI [Micropruina sp. KQZ13P-5]MCW3157384.1 class Ib ribonucleoside-diphosphate reductase assembly flavoprotein NrdI [Micropruina sp. KQZ13P-5]
MVHLVYFSSTSENTHRFVAKLGVDAQRIGLRASDPHLRVDRPYVLVVPTYGGGNGAGAVPKQVIRFLNDPGNRAHLLGVIAAGNTNFGTAYCIAGDIIARKCGVPHLYSFELMGTPDDVEAVREGLRSLWQRQFSPTPA